MLKHCQRIIVLITLCACITPMQAQSIDADTLKVLFTGDVLLDRGVRKRINQIGIDSLMNGVSPLFRSHDAVVINLECPFSERKAFVHKQIVFRADTIMAQGLQRGGVTHVALANNHSVDRGIAGLDDTQACLRHIGIETLGYGSSEQRLSPTIIVQNGIQLAVFNNNIFPIENWRSAANGKNITNISADSLAVVITNYRRQHPDIPIIALLHWGTEFSLTPSMGQIHDAATLVAAGANAIIGHHPHVVQPIKYIGGTPVCFSLGNFIFDQTKPHTTTGMAVSLTVSKNGAIKIIPHYINICNCCPKVAN